jgi:hypothetical protein
MAKANRKSTAPKRAAKALGELSPSKPDPIFAAIAAHEKACAAIMAYCDRGEDVPHTLNHDKELRAMARTVPQTPEGVRALAAHVAKWWHNFFNDVADPEIKRVFQSLAKAMPGARAAKASSPVIDPTLAAIAAYEKSWAAFGDVVSEEAGLETKLAKFEKSIPGLTLHRPTFDIGIPYASFTGEDELNTYFAKQRKAGPPLSLAPISKAAWTKQCVRQQKAALKRLRKARRDLKRQQDKHGWTAHERRYDAANDATEVALEKLVRTVPTTFAGIASLAAWASDNFEEHLANSRWNPGELCFDALARAAKRLDGRRP